MVSKRSAFRMCVFSLCAALVSLNVVAEVNNIEVKPRYRQVSPGSAPSRQPVSQQRTPSQKKHRVPCGGYIYDDVDKPKNMFDKMTDVVGGLASLGRKISLLAGLMVIGSGLMQYSNYRRNPLQTRLLYAITTVFAGVALLGLGFLPVGHVAAVLW